MRKAAILMMYATALYFVLRRYYAQPGNSGLPDPGVMVAPTYLYVILALASDFLGGIPIFLAAGMTIVVAWDSEKQKKEQNQVAANVNQVAQQTTNALQDWFGGTGSSPNTVPPPTKTNKPSSVSVGTGNNGASANLS